MKFSKNFATVLEHNSEQVLGLHTYTLGLNEYADLVSKLSLVAHTYDNIYFLSFYYHTVRESEGEPL